MEAVSEVVIVRLPERIVVPFFLILTSKLPPIGSTPRLTASLEKVQAWDRRTLATFPAIATPEEE